MTDQVYVYPTDTVWGIGGNIFSKAAHIKICKIKQMSSSKPVSMLFSDIQLINDYFQLPDKIDDNWLKKFFIFEATLAVPKSWVKKEIPAWITADSHLIAFRFLDTPEIKQITAVEDVITTTSLNLNGKPSIIDKREAFQFYKEHCFKERFVESADMFLSGSASSIVILDDELNASFIRRGRMGDELEEHCRLLST